LKYFFILCLISFFIVSCKKESPSEPQINASNIEDIKTYNEACRDSIVALDSYGVVIMHKSGSGLRHLLNIGAVSATWSSNKWKILFSNGHELYTINPDGSNMNKLPIQRELILFAIPSPNGEKIAYVAKDTTDIYLSRGWIKVVNVDGSGLRTLTALLPSPNRVTWTPDSKQMIYNSSGDGLFMVSYDGTNNHRIYNSPKGFCSFPSLSRDGSKIAFNQMNDSNTVKIMILDITSGNVKQLTNGPSYDDQPSWSADGEFIIYDRAEPDISSGNWIGPSIWSIDRYGNNNSLVTTISQNIYSPCWQQ
jgi:Tol biopolymer transport system component